MGLGLTFYAGQPLTGSDLVALVNAARNSTAAISAVAVTAGTDTTTSATYVNMAGTGSVTSFSWTKYRDDTDALLFMAAEFQAVTANAGPKFGLRINGTDYDMCSNAPGTSAYGHPSGTRVVSGIPAGVYTVQCRWFRLAGAGTPTRDTNCWLSASVTEIN